MVKEKNNDNRWTRDGTRARNDVKRYSPKKVDSNSDNCSVHRKLLFSLRAFSRIFIRFAFLGSPLFSDHWPVFWFSVVKCSTSKIFPSANESRKQKSQSRWWDCFRRQPSMPRENAFAIIRRKIVFFFRNLHVLCITTRKIKQECFVK